MAKIVKISEKPDTDIVSSMDDLGKFIKHQRTKLGLTRENAADICSINFQTLANIENGNPKCDAGNVLHVAKMLGIKLTAELENE